MYVTIEKSYSRQDEVQTGQTKKTLAIILKLARQTSQLIPIMPWLTVEACNECQRPFVLLGAKCRLPGRLGHGVDIVGLEWTFVC